MVVVSLKHTSLVSHPPNSPSIPNLKSMTATQAGLSLLIGCKGATVGQCEGVGGGGGVLQVTKYGG